jgi:hypothetical protein
VTFIVRTSKPKMARGHVSPSHIQGPRDVLGEDSLTGGVGVGSSGEGGTAGGGWNQIATIPFRSNLIFWLWFLFTSRSPSKLVRLSQRRHRPARAAFYGSASSSDSQQQQTHAHWEGGGTGCIFASPAARSKGQQWKSGVRYAGRGLCRGGRRRSGGAPRNAAGREDRGIRVRRGNC